MSARKAAFAPVVDVQTRLLILGSLPGDQSLAAGQYYANSRNRFWHLVGEVIERPELPELDYGARLEVLLGNGIGLWDAVASAERDGSLDSSIRAVEAAGLGELIGVLPQLRAVAFNGKTSARIARSQLSDRKLDLVDLPSSSPAHAAMSFAGKRSVWLSLRQFLT
ncbi:MAG: DNA-deoxyinosine glycosylase [Novosphingobium sp.]